MADAQALPAERKPLRETLSRFGVASISSALVSASHLLLQLVSIRHLSAIEIGTLAFLLVIIQFGYSLSNALVATPYTMAVNRAESPEAAAVDFFFPVNLLLSSLQGLVCAAIAWTTVGPAAAAVFGLAGFVSLLRWFGRSNAYAHHTPLRATMSDLIYSGLVTAGVGVMLVLGVRIEAIGGTLLCAGIVALLPYGGKFVRRHRLGRLRTALSDYRPVWKAQSAWTLIGVATSEATSNAHSYIVVTLAGPAAFAPIAVGMLFFRPVNVCITALTQVERPRMARAVARGEEQAAKASARAFMAALGAIWLATAAAATIILWRFPEIIVTPALDLGTVTVAVGLCSALALVQCLQAPISVLAQARGLFRPLAAVSARSCFVGIGAVLALTLTTKPVLTIAGVLLAQSLMMIGIYALDRRAPRQIREKAD